MIKTAVVTGAGSGVGRAVALRLAKAGWKVALVGRRPQALDETRFAAGDAGRLLSPFPCDIGDEGAVNAMASKVLSELGAVQVLVNAAGTNIPDRGLSILQSGRFREVMDANLNGSLYCALAFLPGMRERKSGTIINIVSEAGLAASPKAGAAYVASKFAQRGLTQAINSEERPNGIRACAIHPGDIDTPILDKRPVVPTAEARAKMLQADDVAACVMLVIDLPERAVVEELLIRPR